jgi:protein-tyrosine phosphatase
MNFRAIAPYQTPYGKLEANRLFRGGALHALSQEDKKTLEDQYQISLVIDLRSFEEVKHQPDQSLNHVKHIHMTPFPSLAHNMSVPGVQRKLVDMGEDAHNFMSELYGRFVTEPKAQQTYAQLLQYLIDPEYTNFYFHCSAGKDRTGFGAFLIMKLLEIDESDIIKEYLLSNREDAIQQFYKDKVFGDDTDGMSLAQVRFLSTVSPDYLKKSEEAIAAIGGFDVYRKEILKFSDEDKQTLIKKFVQKS